MKNITLEICVGTLEDVKVCSMFPVDRIELTSALELGGLTPSLGLLQQAKAITSIPIACMVRSHATGFVYSDHDSNAMMEDAKQLLEAGVDAIVFGFLNRDHTINKQKTIAMVELIHSYQKEAVFHKAFDQTKNLEDAIKVLIEANVDRVLTEGGLNKSIQAKRATLKALYVDHHQEIQLLVGGGVRSDNVLDIIAVTHTKQIHSSCKSIQEVDGLKLVYVDATKLSLMVKTLNKQ
jgi:copper homeostasis protein